MSTLLAAKTRPHHAPPALYGWGYNNVGGLGTGTTARTPRPAPLDLPDGIVDLQGGTDFTVALTSAGQVYCWGANKWGQLGDATTRPRLAPQVVALPGHPHVVAIAVGGDHVIVMDRHGKLFGWGRNHRGQLGTGTPADRCPTPLTVSGTEPAVRIAAGNACSFAVLANGKTKAWGYAAPFGAAVAASAVASTRGGVATAVTPQRLTLLHGAQAAALDAGQRHLVVLTTSGKLQTFGLTAAGRPALGAVTTNASWGKITAVSAGDNHSLALTEEGVVLAWGANRSGQLGSRTTKRSDTPVKVYISGQRGRVVQVVAAGDTSFARTDAGHLYSWGHGGWGQHGSGRVEDQLRPERLELPNQAHARALFAGRFHCFARIA